MLESKEPARGSHHITESLGVQTDQHQVETNRARLCSTRRSVMAGAPPYNMQSPTQQQRYPSYSPSTRERQPYASNNDPYQHPPRTPPSFPPPSSLARSPHYVRAASPINTLPPLNGPVVNADGSPPYHAHSTSSASAYALPRPFNGSLMSSTSHSPPPTYSHPAGSHSLASNMTDPFSRSPRRDSESYGMGSANGGHISQQTMRPPSPKESVCVKNFL